MNLFSRFFKKSKHAPRHYNICHDWGDRIEWTNRGQFKGAPDNAVFDVNGHQAKIPEVGDILRGEFSNYAGEHCIREFVFIEVKPCGDPHDMFFAKVKRKL